METTMIKPTMKGHFVKHYLASIPFSLAFLAGGAAFLAFVPDADLVWAALLFAAGVLASGIPAAHSVLYCRATTVSFDGDKIVLETGILDHRKKKVPVNMVTDSSASRTFIERFFGTGTLNISTSGSTGYEIVCHGLDYRELDSMHNMLYEKIRRAGAERQSAPGAADDAARPR